MTHHADVARRTPPHHRRHPRRRRDRRRGQARRRPARRHGAARRGPPAAGGRPGRRQDDARQGARPRRRLLGAPHPVHPRPAAERRHRRQHLQPGAAGLRVQAGRRLRERGRRRRDQPRQPEDAVRPAGVHGGAAGHRRRRDLPAAAAVHRHRDPEPDRDGGHLPAARGAARPVHGPAVDGLPVGRRRGRDARPARRHDPLATLAPVADAETVRRLIATARGGLRLGRGQGVRGRASSGPPGRPPTCAWAPRRAPRCTCCGPPRRTPRWPAASTSCRTTSRSSSHPVLAHRLLPSADAQLARRTPEDVLARRARPGRPSRARGPSA